MPVWEQDTKGWRYWPKIPDSPRWRYTSDDFNLEARASDGTPIPLSNRWDSAARERAGQLYAGIMRATDEPFFRRALLTIATHESGGVLPAWGDCRDSRGTVVVCGEPGAKPPLSVGYYQFLRSTAADLGTDFAQLAKSPRANHRAALKLAMKHARGHGGDMVTLAAQWGAGSVRPSKWAPWRIVAWRPNDRDPGAYPTISEYASTWNSAGRAIADYDASDLPIARGGGVVLLAAAAALGVALIRRKG